MKKCFMALGRIDPYVVTGSGQTGSIEDGSRMLYNNDDTVVTLHIGDVELALIFSPATPDMAIEGQVSLLREAGLALEDVEGLVFVNNEDIRKIIAVHQALPGFLCVLDLPIYRVQGGLVWIGAAETEAPPI